MKGRRKEKKGSQLNPTRNGSLFRNAIIAFYNADCELSEIEDL